MLLIDKYAYTNKLTDLNPQAKFILACVGLFILRIFDNTYLYITNIILMLFITVFVAKIPIKAYLKMFFIPFIFLIVSLITIMISINNTDYLISIKIFNTFLGITKESLIEGRDLFILVISSLSSVYFFILTTPINKIIKGMKKLKVPDLFIELMILIYRSIFIFLEEMNNMRRVQVIKFGYENKTNWINSTSILITNLFKKIFEKHKQMSISLECKLFDGEFKIGD